MFTFLIEGFSLFLLNNPVIYPISPLAGELVNIF